MSLDELRYKVYELALKLNRYEVIADIIYLSVVELHTLHSTLLRWQDGY